MTTLTRNAIAEAVENGTGLAHLTPGQTWAAHHLKLSPEQLQPPILPHIAVLMERTVDMARRHFFEGVAPDDTDTMIQRSYNEAHPMFLRGPILETLKEGMGQCFPDLKPSGVDQAGRQLFHLADLARVLGVSEEALLAHAEKVGMTGQLNTTPPNPLH